MDVCNAVKGKLVPVTSILIDVGDCQSGQLLHRFVIAGYGRKLNGCQGETLAVRKLSVKQKKARQQQKCAGRMAHGGGESSDGSLGVEQGLKWSLFSCVYIRSSQWLLESKQIVNWCRGQSSPRVRRSIFVNEWVRRLPSMTMRRTEWSVLFSIRTRGFSVKLDLHA